MGKEEDVASDEVGEGELVSRVVDDGVAIAVSIFVCSRYECE